MNKPLSHVELAKKIHIDKLPFNLDAERGVLQCLIGGNIYPRSLRDSVLETIGQRTAQNSPFFEERNTDLYLRIQGLEARGALVDAVTVKNALGIGLADATYVAELIGGSDQYDPRRAEEYARIVVDDYRRREAILTLDHGRKLAQSGEVGADEVLEFVESGLFELRADTLSKGPQAAADTVDAVMKQVELASQTDGPIGLPTGIGKLDRLSNGFARADQTIIAAASGMGKTSLAVAILANAVRQGYGCVYFSLEMTVHQLMLRVLANLSKVPHSKLRRGQMSMDEWASVRGASEFVKKQKCLFIDDKRGLTTMDIRSRLRRVTKSIKLSFVFVDYLQIMSGEGKDHNREREVAKISMQLRALWQEFDVTGIVLSQLNRGVDNRDNSKPRLSDLRESGAIEQDADRALFLYYPYRQKDDVDHPETEPVDLLVLKERHEKTAEIQMVVSKSIYTFTERLPDFAAAEERARKHETRGKGAAGFRMMRMQPQASQVEAEFTDLERSISDEPSF